MCHGTHVYQHTYRIKGNFRGQRQYSQGWGGMDNSPRKKVWCPGPGENKRWLLQAVRIASAMDSGGQVLHALGSSQLSSEWDSELSQEASCSFPWLPRPPLSTPHLVSSWLQTAQDPSSSHSSDGMGLPSPLALSPTCVPSDTDSLYLLKP